MSRYTSKTAWRIRLVTIVGLFLAAVLIADHMGLTNHA